MIKLMMIHIGYCDINVSLSLSDQPISKTKADSEKTLCKPKLAFVVAKSRSQESNLSFLKYRHINKITERSCQSQPHSLLQGTKAKLYSAVVESTLYHNTVWLRDTAGYWL